MFFYSIPNLVAIFTNIKTTNATMMKVMKLSRIGPPFRMYVGSNGVGSIGGYTIATKGMMKLFTKA